MTDVRKAKDLGIQAAAAALTSKTASASSINLVASNASRRGLIIVNDSTAILYVKYGSTATASTGGYTYKLAAGATLEMDDPAYTGAVDGIWSAANGGASITEIT